MAKQTNKQRVKAETIIFFCDGMKLLLGSGMRLYECTESMAAMRADQEDAALLQAVNEQVTATGSLYQALKQDERWPVHMTEMIGVGESTGRLEETLGSLSAYYDREKRIRSAVVNAVTYPAMLSGLLAAVVLVMLAAVLPVFSRLLAGLGSSVGAASQAMTGMGRAIGWAVVAVVGVLLVGMAVLALLQHFGKGQAVRGLIDRLPRVKRLQAGLDASRLCSVLGMAVSGGYAMDEALNMALPVLSSENAQSSVKRMLSAMEEGMPFADALADTRLLSEMHSHLVRMAVQAGRVDEVLSGLADEYEQQAEQEMNALVAVIEPTLVALLCLVIGAMLLSVMLPLAGVIAGMM